MRRNDSICLSGSCIFKAQKREFHWGGQYSPEYTNNILFKVIEAYPSDFVEVFSTSKIIDKNILLLQISNPIKDYNTPVLIQKIELSKGDNYSKAQIVKALKEIK